MTDLEITRLCAEAMGWQHLGAVGVDLEAEGVESPSEADRRFPGKLWCLSGGNNWWRHPEGDTVCGHCESIPDPLHDDAQAMALVKRFKLHIYTVTGMSDHWIAHQASGTHTGAQSTNLNRAICLAVAKMQRGLDEGGG
jgi:hypothetical protein